MTSDSNTQKVANEINRLIRPKARERLRATIQEYQGDEVFFVCRVDANGVVERVEAKAFGNQDAVPVIEQTIEPGNVVIHNHPGGDLRPSQADIEIASRLGNTGVGSYIIDNTATHIRIIVPAMAPRERKALDTAQLEDILAPNGRLAHSMGGYEHRAEQTRMLGAVADAFNNNGIAIIEAGTGTGKSLAYLIPSIHWARTNGEKVVVSTNTINLQEQLITKDIPFLQKHLGIEFKAEMMKGRNNYICKRKSQYLHVTPDFFGDDRTSSQLQSILEWARETRDGSLSDLAFIPDRDAWEQVSCDGDNCTRVKCPHYAACYFYQARRRAAFADLLIVNHHLLMADLSVRLDSGNFTSTAVLPVYKRIILDEAHNVEDVATRYFGIAIRRRSLDRLLARLVHRERSNLGLLPFLRNSLAQLGYKHPSESINSTVRLIEETLIPLRHSLAQALKDLMDLAARGAATELNERLVPRKEMKLRITGNVEKSTFWNRDFRLSHEALAEQLQRFTEGLRQVYTTLNKLPEVSRKDLDVPAGEINSLSTRFGEKLLQLKKFYTVGDGQCRWIEAFLPGNSKVPSVGLISLPLEVRDHLNKALFQKIENTVIMTSATLSVDRRFDFFLGQMGLGDNALIPEVRARIETLQLDTSFDFESQAFVGIPTDIPEPREREFDEAAAAFLLPALQISQGSAFLLFTSYRQLNSFHKRLAPVLEPLGYSCLKQGTENRQTLLKRFKNDRTSILFATASFWEGVDVPGDALQLLVLVKLPFRVPTDPLLQARVERLEAMGVDAFSEYSVPQAVIRFKQGFGRLIRTRSDRGAVIALDKRLVTKRYGRVFLNSLPAQTIHRKPGVALLDDLRAFF